MEVRVEVEVRVDFDLLKDMTRMVTVILFGDHRKVKRCLYIQRHYTIQMMREKVGSPLHIYMYNIIHLVATTNHQKPVPINIPDNFSS